MLLGRKQFLRKDRGWKAPWLQIVPSSKLKLKSPLVADKSNFRVGKPFDYLLSRSRWKRPFGHRHFLRQDRGWKAPWSQTIPSCWKAPWSQTALVSTLKRPLIAFRQDRGWKAPLAIDNYFVKIEVEKPLWSHTIPLLRSRLKSPLVADSSFVKIEVKKPLSCRQFLCQDRCWKGPWS